MTNKKKLLFFHFDMSGGGAEKVLVNLLNRLDPDKYDITLSLVFGVGCNLDNLASHIRVKSFFKRPFRGASTLMKLFSPRLLHKIFVKDEYDMEIAYLEYSPTRIISGCRNPKTKKVAWVHQCRIDIPGVFRNKKEMRRCYEQFDKIVCVSKESRHSFIKATGWDDLPVNVLYNVLDTGTITTRASEQTDITMNHDILNLCSVGKLEKAKGSIRLVKSLCELSSQGINNWQLYLLGIGNAKDEIIKIATEHGILDKITFLGYQTNPYKYLSKMDIFVCPSTFEGYSTATIEALLLGVPVLTTDCGGMQEILDNGKYGLIVDNSDDGLTDGLQKFLTDSELLAHYREMSVKRTPFFDPVNVVAKTEQFFDDLLK